MNILVADKNNSFYFRPDSSLIRALDDYYIPDYVEQVECAPILYIKTLKPGKSVAKRFLHRYLDSYGFGYLLFPKLDKNIVDNREFLANCLDYTTIIPLDYNKIELYSQDNYLPNFTINGAPILNEKSLPNFDSILEHISSISNYYSFKIGDFICFPLANNIKVAANDCLCTQVENKATVHFKVL